MGKSYKIGDVAQILGLTPETIRHYERIGLIAPRKDESSSYRYYDAWDLILLSACRQYRSLGFSLEDSAHIIGDQNPDGALTSLMEQEAFLEQQIKQLEMQLSTLRAWRQDARRQCELLGTYRIEETTETYMLTYQVNGVLTEDGEVKSMMKEWFSFIPYVYVGMTVDSVVKTGICMSIEAVPFLKPTRISAACRLPKVTAIHTAFLYNRHENTIQHAVGPIQDYAKKCGYKAKGPVFCRCDFLFSQKRKLSNVLLDCYLPIQVDSQTV